MTTAPWNPQTFSLAVLWFALSTLLALASCGGGAGGPGGPGTTHIVEWYDSAQTQMKAEGQATVNVDGSHVREGRWSEYFPAAEGGGVQWARSYANGNWDRDQAWTEFNADGSWRVDRDDR